MRSLVRDVMSIRLLTAGPDTPIQQVIRTMVRARIGGLPIVDQAGKVHGMVCRSDLLAMGERRPRSRTAADVMTSPVVTLTEEDSVPEAARVLRRHHIKRAPVLREGRIVGVVTQSDLLRPYLRTDSEIRADVEEAFLEGAPGEPDVGLTVGEGVVSLRGRVQHAHTRSLLRLLARSVDGVIDVVDQLDGAPGPPADGRVRPDHAQRDARATSPPPR